MKDVVDRNGKDGIVAIPSGSKRRMPRGAVEGFANGFEMRGPGSAVEISGDDDGVGRMFRDLSDL